MNSFDDLSELGSRFQISRIFITACELKIFNYIANGANSIDMISKKGGLDKRALNILLTALAAIGLIEKKGELYYNSKIADEFLVEGKPNYRGSIFFHHSHLWNEWSSLTEIVKNGKSTPDSLKNILSEYEEKNRSFISGMDNIARDLAPIIVDKIDLNGVRKLLDIGGGLGTYSIHFAKRYKYMNSVIFDLPLAIKIAKNNVKKEELLERFDFMEGDFFIDNIGEGYDFVWASHIIHSSDYNSCEMLMNKIFKALNRGGRIAIHDFILNEDGISPTFSAIFAVNMLVMTEGGKTYKFSEISDWLSRVGFENISLLKATPKTAIVVGSKNS